MKGDNFEYIFCEAIVLVISSAIFRTDVAKEILNHLEKPCNNKKIC